MMTKTRGSMQKRQEDFNRMVLKWDLALSKFPLLFHHLEEMEVIPDFDRDGDISLRFTGDSVKLSTVWKHLRIAGWSPISRPEEGSVTGFNTFFYPPENDETLPRFWVVWSNSVCKLKKVGVKQVTREEAVYEVDCGEQTPLGELLSSEDDPRYNQVSESEG